MKDIEGNKVLEAHVNRDFPVALVEVTNPDIVEDGKFAVITDCGFNPTEGFNELDYQFFDSLEAAQAAYDKEVQPLIV